MAPAHSGREPISVLCTVLLDKTLYRGQKTEKWRIVL